MAVNKAKFIGGLFMEENKAIEAIYKIVNDNEITVEEKEVLENNIDFLVGDNNLVSRILTEVFGEKIPVGSDYYETLSKLLLKIKRTQAEQLLGALWSVTCDKLPVEDKKTLLTLLARQDKYFWEFIPALPVLLSRIELEPAFAANWFLQIYERVKNDLAGGSFYQALEKYVYAFPSSGLKVLEYYISIEVNEAVVAITSIILGSLRAVSEKGYLGKEVVEELDKRLVNDKRAEVRTSYFRSWIISLKKGYISVKELEDILQQALMGSDEEKEEAFNIVRMMVFVTKNLDSYESILYFIMHWLKNNIISLKTPDVQFSVLNAVNEINRVMEEKEHFAAMSELDEMVYQIQPIPDEYAGIWRELESYFVARLKQDSRSLFALLDKIAQANSQLIKRLLNSELHHFESYLPEYEISSSLISLLFSDSRRSRKLGLALFRRVKTDDFAPHLTEDIPEKNIYLLLLEITITPHLMGDELSRIFPLLESIVRNKSDKLKNEFKEEMLVQAKNYPGNCLEYWKTLKGFSPLLEEVVRSAEAYFERLNEIKMSPANSFGFPDYFQAEKRGKRKIAQEISEKARQESIFHRFVRQVNIIYGDKWCIYNEKYGVEGEPRGFKEFSEVIEFPRLEGISPEAMALNRLEASERIYELSGDEDI